jgi:hypothetical protein
LAVDFCAAFSPCACQGRCLDDEPKLLLGLRRDFGLLLGTELRGLRHLLGGLLSRLDLCRIRGNVGHGTTSKVVLWPTACVRRRGPVCFAADTLPTARKANPTRAARPPEKRGLSNSPRSKVSAETSPAPCSSTSD